MNSDVNYYLFTVHENSFVFIVKNLRTGFILFNKIEKEYMWEKEEVNYDLFVS